MKSLPRLSIDPLPLASTGAGAAWTARLDRALAEVSRAAVSSTSLEDLANIVLQAARSLTRSGHGYVSSIDPVTGDSVGHTLTDMMADCQVAARDKKAVFPLDPSGRYSGLWGHALTTKEGFFTNDPQDHRMARGLPPGHIPLQNFLTVPVLVGPDLVGQIALANATHDYTERDLKAVERLAQLYGPFVMRLRQEAELRTRTAALRSREQRYRALFEGAFDGFAVHELICDEAGRPCDYRFLEVNPAFERLTGLQADAIVGRTVREVMPETEDFWIERYAHVALTGEPIQFEHHSAVLGRDYEVRAYRTEPMQFATLFQDVSAERHRQQAERELGRKLQETQKMEAVGRLAGGIAHDFNNLLTGIAMNTGIGLLDVEPGTDAAEALQEIQTVATRAAELTRQLLTFARKEPSNKETLSVVAVVESWRRMLMSMLGERIQLTLHTAAQPCVVWGDRARLEQVLVNLVVNARDAMPDGGTLAISVEPFEVEAGTLAFGTHPVAVPVPSGHYVKLLVEDTGTGIPAGIRDQVFEPFFTTKERETGTGLGLAAVYGTVRDHDGFLDLESTEGRGTRVTILLPSQEGTVADCRDTIERAPVGTESVLLVEDDALTRLATARSLRRLGYLVTEATSAEEALEHYEAVGRQPIDLVLTDIVLPGMDGRELIRQLQDRYGQIRGVVMSGYAQRDLEPGVRFLPKPYDSVELARAIREALDVPLTAGPATDTGEA